MFLVDWAQSITEAAFTEPLAALLIGVVVGGVIGYAMAASGGLRWS